MPTKNTVQVDFAPTWKGTGSHERVGRAGLPFDSSTITADANGRRWLKSNWVIQLNTVSGKYEKFDNENGSPTYDPIGINDQYLDLTHGDRVINPIMKGQAMADWLEADNTGGGTDPISGSALQTAIESDLPHIVFIDN